MARFNNAGDRLVDYRSGEFISILNVVNALLANYYISEIAFSNTQVKEPGVPEYNRDALNTHVVWRVTQEDYPKLVNKKLYEDLKSELHKHFPAYTAKRNGLDSVIRLRCDECSKQASISVLLADLKDNQFTPKDLLSYHANPAYLDGLFNRMYKRNGDSRTNAQRVQAFLDSYLYESKLSTLSLKGVENLRLMHSLEVYSIVPDRCADFEADILGEHCYVEAKSTYKSIPVDVVGLNCEIFNSFILNHAASFGSTHGAKYTILIFKQSKDMIIYEVENPKHCWYLGKIDVNFSGLGDN